MTLRHLFWVKVVDPEKPKEPRPKEDAPEDNLGLPELVQTYQDKGERTNAVDWSVVEDVTGMTVDHEAVMIPEAERGRAEEDLREHGQPCADRVQEQVQEPECGSVGD